MALATGDKAGPADHSRRMVTQVGRTPRYATVRRALGSNTRADRQGKLVEVPLCRGRDRGAPPTSDPLQSIDRTMSRPSHGAGGVYNGWTTIWVAVDRPPYPSQRTSAPHVCSNAHRGRRRASDLSRRPSPGAGGCRGYDTLADPQMQAAPAPVAFLRADHNRLVGSPVVPVVAMPCRPYRRGSGSGTAPTFGRAQQTKCLRELGGSDERRSNRPSRRARDRNAPQFG